jgi:UPF0716 family protein affecting phage T7 exclusion
VFSRIRYRISSKYVVITTVVMVVVFGILFFWISGRHTQLIIQQVHDEGVDVPQNEKNGGVLNVAPSLLFT